MIVERQVMAENKAEFVHASCKLVNIWASPIPSEERLLFITEVSFEFERLEFMRPAFSVTQSDGYTVAERDANGKCHPARSFYGQPSNAGILDEDNH